MIIVKTYCKNFECEKLGWVMDATTNFNNGLQDQSWMKARVTEKKRRYTFSIVINNWRFW